MRPFFKINWEWVLEGVHVSSSLDLDSHPFVLQIGKEAMSLSVIYYCNALVLITVEIFIYLAIIYNFCYLFLSLF